MTSRILVFSILIAASQWFGGAALAQDAGVKPHVPLAKKIGKVTPTGPVPSLFVLNSSGAKLEGGKLTMNGVAANSIVFADRPVRAAGHVTTEQFIKQWDEGADNFIKDPPNATISVLGGDGSKVEDAVVTLMKPRLEGGNLTFDVAVLEGSLSGGGGPAALFIDRGGGSFGGGGGDGGSRGGDAGGDRPSFGDDGDRSNYWHAPVYHGAWYAGTDAERPYYRYGYNRCGYYPNPPCY